MWTILCAFVAYIVTGVAFTLVCVRVLYAFVVFTNNTQSLTTVCVT